MCVVSKEKDSNH